MTTKINVLFFASLADTLDCKNEQLELPITTTTVSSLKAFLAHKGESWLALQNQSIRCAVNQNIVSDNHPIQDGDEIAFFPPVTGG